MQPQLGYHKADIVGAYLPLAGGTLTGATATASGISFTVGGALTGTSATFTKSGADPNLVITNSTAGGDFIHCIGDAGDTVFKLDSGGTGGEAVLQMYSDGVSKALIQANGNSYFLGGNIGIGTASPLEKLQVQGNIRLDWGTDRTIEMWYSADYRIGMKLIGNERRLTLYSYRLDGDDTELTLKNGNVGIGTTSPAGVKFQTVQTTSGDWTGGFKNYTANGYGLRVDMSNSSSVQSALQVYTGAGGGFVVKNTGNVAIGTTTPIGKLTVQGDDADIFLRSNDYTIARIINRGSTHPNLDIGIFSLYNANAENVRLDGGGTSWLNSGNVGIGTTSPSQKLEVTGNFKLNGTLVQEGTGNNLTYKYRTANSSAYTGGTATCKFGRFYWTPAHWVTGAPVIKVTLHCKYYQGERREYIIKAGYQNTDPVINELQPSSTQQRITLLVGATTSAGYNYAGQPVYYVDLQWVQTAYIWGWAQIESQVGFLTSNPTSTWGGVVMDSGITQTNNSGTPTNYTSFFPGRILLPGLDGKTQVHPDVSYRTSDGELFYQTSSERYKTDIVNLESSLNKVNSLRPVRFTDINTNEPGFGLIAEETVDVIPDVVFSKDEQIEGISYSNLVPFLIKSIQELEARVKELENK